MDGIAGFRASYFVHKGVRSLAQIDFTAAPAFQTTVPQLDIRGLTGPLWPGGPSDNFAARYTGDFQIATSGTYTFHLTADDGAGLWIDGRRVLLDDGIHAARTTTASVTLDQGIHRIELRHFEATGQTSLGLDISGPGLARSAFLPGRIASDAAPDAPHAGPDRFALSEGARDVPLAVFVNDSLPPGTTLALGPASHGSLRLDGGLPVYTAEAGHTGPATFTYTLTAPGQPSASATVTLDIRPAHAQPQTALDPRIAPEILPSGLTLDVARYAFIGTDPGGAAYKMNTFAEVGGRQFVGSTGRSGLGNGAVIHELVEGPDGTRTASVFLDIDAAVRAATGRSIDYTNVTHGGLRGLAFHPDFALNGLVYTSLMETRPTGADPRRYLSDVANPIAADSVLVEWRVNLATGAVDPASYREVFRVGMPVYDHTIRQMAFNPYARPGDADYGLLYIAHGDGSVQSATTGGGQNDDALGKILRIDPRATATAPFGIPADNPFLGDPEMIDAAYAIGLRNPHNLAFAPGPDGRARLIVTDIGRDNFNEINLVTPGANHGWSDREGPLVHLPGGGIVTGLGPLPADEAARGYAYPAAFLGLDGPTGGRFVGQALAGGHVIDNGSDLDGQFIFGDFGVSGRLFHVPFDDLLAARTTLRPGQTAADLSWATPSAFTLLFDHDDDPTTPGIAYPSLNALLGLPRSDLRFGRGADGEIYITNKHDGWVYLVGNSLPDSPATGLTARHYAAPTATRLSDVNWAATPIHREIVDRIDENPGTGAFFAGGPTDRFAVRYTGTFDVGVAGRHTFHLTSDDGAALFIDGRRVIDNDGIHGARLREASVTLDAGRHQIDLRYFEATGRARVDLDWTGPAFTRRNMDFGPREAPERLVAETFETSAEGWSNPTRTVGGDPFGGFLGRFAAGASTEKTYRIDPAIARLAIGFDLYEIDSWDGPSGDAFHFDLNGTRLISRALQHAGFGTDGPASGAGPGYSWTMTPLTDGATSLGFARWSDQIHRVTLVLDDPAETLALRFGSSLNSGLADESFGIDNLTLTALAFDALI